MWSSLITPTFLFLSFFSVELAPNPESATDENDSYPPFWDQINGDIAEFPVQNDKTIIDPSKYIDRLRMYKILIEKSNKYFAGLGNNKTDNVLWTLTIFYGKLYEGDRLSDPSNSSVCAYDAETPGCVSINSGWGGINFYVIVLYFLAAIESEFLKDLPYQVELVSQEEYRSDFCYSIAECRASYPQAMDTVNRFFKYLMSREVTYIIKDVPYYNIDEDTVILYMWEAHQVGIDIATSKFSDVSFYSSETERDFSLDFLVTVEFLEAALYRPYFEIGTELLEGFPHRLLTDQDRIVLTSNFNIREKAFMTSVKLISKTNKLTGGAFFTIWNKVMNLKPARSLARFLTNRLLLIPIS
ncbi:protein LEG1 homolog [Pipistrellus kuhlii]|uniref:protein LEG1 homolog n=1 Tax=Pipistrellus kuhlii TaxID=59472 RepID=UPI00174F6AA3|nr:protein LEG1 homolog [Pipistrellus kuhlii]